ncbi:MAG: N-acetyl-gamma-glutamyl-phosphate reductase, partial [Bacteroidota bacterium]|nr:N-acetyl-gamma-glutamyl-phosphate reductase [Bacteroidota bacterium]
MKKKIKISILGASGYTGGELIRLLLNHPLCEIVSLSSNFNSGKKISDIHNDLVGDSDLVFSKEIDKNVDVIYLCSGHGKSSAFLKSIKIDKEVRIIDLSQDFRVDNLFEDRVFEYGLPEINKSNILSSNNIANPGCFATAIQLGILPLISINFNSQEIHTHAITGSTGAGLKLTETSHFSWRNNNVSWYKPFTHQHLNEVYKTIEKKYNINFIPIRGNFSRGIFCTSYIKTELDIDSIYKIYF